MIYDPNPFPLSPQEIADYRVYNLISSLLVKDLSSQDDVSPEDFHTLTLKALELAADAKRSKMIPKLVALRNGWRLDDPVTKSVSDVATRIYLLYFEQ